MDRPARVAVFASGGGTNLQALLDYFNRETDRAARVELVVASRPGIGALARASAAGVPAAVIEPGRAAEEVGTSMQKILEENSIELIALAGYLKLIPSVIVRGFERAILNIHPALLPAFGGRGMYGMKVHEAVLASGARVSGATVHYVDERYDEGPIIAQWPVPVLPEDTPERLAARVLRVEHMLYPLALEAAVLGGERGGAGSESSFEIRDVDAPGISSIRRLVR